MKLSELTSFKLIELLESATELFINKKYYGKDFVEKYLGLSLQRSNFYGTVKEGQYVAENKNKTSFNSEQDVQVVVEGILLLDEEPVNVGAGSIEYVGYGVLEVDGTVIYDGRGGGDTTPSLFLNDIPVILDNGKSLGKYLNGDTIPAIGKTPEQVITDIAAEYIAPSITSFSMGLPVTVEVGTIFTDITTATWVTSQPGNVQPNSIHIEDLTNNNLLVGPTINDGNEAIDVDLFGPIQKTTESSHSWRISLDNTQGGSALKSTSTAWSYKQFYGTGTIPTNSSEVRALGNERYNNIGNSFTLNTGSTDSNFIVALPVGKSISSVVDLDALNSVITSEYVNTGSITVTLQEGITATYNIYVMNQAIAYTSNHRHSITLS